MDLRHRETSAQRRTVVDEARFREYLADVTSEGLIARCQALSDPLRTLHRRIVSRFADTDRAPSSESLRTWAGELHVDAADSLAQLMAVDLAQGAPETGRVYGAYPFVSEPRGHRVDIDGGPTVEATCAVDALGISANAPSRRHHHLPGPPQRC